MTPPLVDAHGRSFPLARHLASGGEGAVFTLPSDPAQLAKVYLRPGGPERGEKLAALIARATPALAQTTAWPTALLFDARTRAAVGFVMPAIADGQPVQQLYNPAVRLRAFPRAGWAFQVRAACNLAAAFDDVHAAGCLVGDVNQSNALVRPDARVGLIDCDSFQVRANGRVYTCDVGTPHYTPPELQGAHLRGLARTENHDRFGLAVLIYQLLFVGRHPYAGVYSGSGDPSFEELIAGYRFAQGPKAHTWGMAPPPHTPTFADVPPGVAALFRRAFERGSEADARPRAAEWLPVLRQLEAETAACATDPGHKFWRGAPGGCVWCRLAANGGPEYYFGAGGTAAAFAVDEARLREVAERLERVALVEFRYDREHFMPPAPPAPLPLPDDLAEQRATTRIVSAAAVLCALATPLGLIRGFIAVIALLAALVFGAWFAVLAVSSPWQQELRRRRRAYARAAGDLDDLEAEWDGRVRKYRQAYADGVRRVRRPTDECRRLADQYQAELRQLATSAEEAARRRHLRLHLLADADIPGVKAGRKQALAAAGIVTAADVSERRVREIKGFGDALTDRVLVWRDEVMRAFRFDPQAAVSPGDRQAAAVRLRARHQQLLLEADRRLAELDGLAPACRAALKELIPELTAAAAAWEQAAADYRLVRRAR